MLLVPYLPVRCEGYSLPLEVVLSRALRDVRTVLVSTPPLVGVLFRALCARCEDVPTRTCSFAVDLV